MKFRNFTLLMLCAALMLTGCGTIGLGSGTLSIDPNEISKIEITNGLAEGSTFTVQDREAITKIVQYLNSYTLENGTDPANGWSYSLTLRNSSGQAHTETAIIDESHVILDGSAYFVNAKDLLNYVEKLECDTKTDQELIDILLQGDTLDRLNILDEDGKISLDKIVGLADSCPALFELLSRPTILESIGGYGLKAIENALESGNIALIERAEALAEILKNYFPDLQTELDKILENIKK